MGLFDSKTKQTVTQNTTTVTDTTQADQSGNEGLNLAQIGGGVGLDLSTQDNRQDNSSTVTTTTVNALDAGALKVAGNIAEQALSVAGGGVANALAANGNALDFGRQAIENVAAVNSNSLDLFGGLVSDAFDTSRTLARDVIQANADSLAQFSNFARTATADAVAGFGALSKQSSASTDDRVTKLAGYALAAIAAVFILPALFKGRASA